MLSRLFPAKGPRFDLATTIPLGLRLYAIACVLLLAGAAVSLGIAGGWETAAIGIVTAAVLAVIVYYSLQLYLNPLLNSVELAPDRMIVRSFGSVMRLPYAKVGSIVPDQVHPRSFWHWPRVPHPSRPHVDVVLRSRFWFYGNGLGWPVKTLHLALDRPADFAREIGVAKDRALRS